MLKDEEIFLNTNFKPKIILIIDVPVIIIYYFLRIIARDLISCYFLKYFLFKNILK